MNDTQRLQLIGTLLGATSTPESTPVTQLSNDARSFGQCIAVLDRGWVYVGTVTTDGSFVRIENAKCIRRWGTSKGLGELRNGPLENTIADESGLVIATLKALIHLIPCKGF